MLARVVNLCAVSFADLCLRYSSRVDSSVVTLVILAVAVIAFVSNRVSIVAVAVAVPVALWATGVLELKDAFAGFGDPTVIFIAALFVVSEALDATGVTSWAAHAVLGAAGTSKRRIVVVIMLLVAVLSALISLNGAVAALLPVVVVIAARIGVAPSKLLLPLAFASHAGSMLALTGTPVNIIVSNASVDAGDRPFTFFEFGLAGIPLLIGTVVIVVFFGDRLLPKREPATLATDLSDHTQTLKEHYHLPTASVPVLGSRAGAVEVLIPPRSTFIGRKVFTGMTTRTHDLVVVALRRGNENRNDVILRAGDSLVLQGDWANLDRYTDSPDVIAVDNPSLLRRTVPLGAGAKRAIGILAVMVVLLATGVVPPSIAALGAAIAIIVTRAVSVKAAFRGISWSTVILVAGVIPLSTAFMSTGAADSVADVARLVVGDSGPHVALLVVCVVTLVLGQLISNTATVLILIPVAVSLANGYDVSVLPFLMALTVTGAAAFMTPIATPANTMVYEPGGYRFGDYWKLGLPLLVMYLLVAVLWVPVIWPF